MIYLVLFIFGAMAGSFLIASVWRLRAGQLAESYSKSEEMEYFQLVKKSKLNSSGAASDHSRCLKCGYQLRWYDLIPVISWLSLGGKCRNCRNFIGWLEVVGEIAVGGLFAGSYYFWQQSGFFDQSAAWIGFGLWLICLMLLVVLFVYDLKWMLLPSFVLYSAIAAAGIFAIWRQFFTVSPNSIMNNLGAIVILFGLYFLLSLFSRQGKALVGDGDAWLGLSLALLLGDFKLAFLTLFLANLIGVVIALPSLISKKINWGQQLPLGPLLIIGFFISYFIGYPIVGIVFFI